MPKLIVERGVDRGKEIALPGDTTMVSGRADGADIHLTDSMASREHFSIERRSDSYYVIDLESRNGTYLNGKRVDEHELRSGDRIQVGETVFSFVDEAVEGIRGDLIGKTIGGYRIEERIGRGGMGTVYRAVQESLERTVALKVLSPERVEDEQFRKMFLVEARAAGRLNHPHIVSVYDVGSDGDIHYFSMEYLSGGSLREVLAGEKKMDLDEAVHAMIEAASALEYAEKMGIVHRDIKPDNLMRAEDGSIKICDLGLAREISTLSEGKETVCGSPLYLSPEQAQGKPVDPRSDIYSLGATFYRLLAGVPPFSGKHIREILDKHIGETPLPVTHYNPAVPPAIERIVARMLQKDPADRFPSATSLLIALDQARSPEPTRIGFDVVPGRTAATRRNRLLGGIAVMAAGVAIAGYLLYPPEPEPPGAKPPPGRGRPGATNLQRLYGEALKAKREKNYAGALERFDKIIAGYPGTREYDQAIVQRKEVSDLLRRARNQEIRRLGIVFAEKLEYLIKFSEASGVTHQNALDRMEGFLEELKDPGHPEGVREVPFRTNKTLLVYATELSKRIAKRIETDLEVTQEIAERHAGKGEFLAARNLYLQFKKRSRLFHEEADAHLAALTAREDKAIAKAIRQSDRLAGTLFFGRALKQFQGRRGFFRADAWSRIAKQIESLNRRAHLRYVAIEGKALVLAEKEKYQEAIETLKPVAERFGIDIYVSSAKSKIAELEKGLLHARRFAQLEDKVRRLAETFRFANASTTLSRNLAAFAKHPKRQSVLKAEIRLMTELASFMAQTIKAIQRTKPSIHLTGRGTVVDLDLNRLWIQERVGGGADGIRWSNLKLKEVRYLVRRSWEEPHQRLLGLHRFAQLCAATGSSEDDFALGLATARGVRRMLKKIKTLPDPLSGLSKSLAAYPTLLAARIVARIRRLHAQGGAEPLAQAARLEAFLREPRNGLSETKEAKNFLADPEENQ